MIGYGHVTITSGGQIYNLLPSFENISKLGSPEFIIDAFNMISDESTPWYQSFDLSLTILQCCSDKPLPKSLTGYIEINGWKKTICYMKGDHGESMFNDVYVLAAHMLKHGICGDVKNASSGGEPMKSFEATDFINIALEQLNCTKEDALSMTMTEFVKRIEAKFPQEIKDKNSRGEVDDIYAWAESQEKH